MIPSFYGNKIEAKLVDRKTNWWYCYKNSDWYLLWFDQREFYPFAANCFIENMQLQYNVTSHIYQEPKGEYVRIPDYGGMDSCNFIDSNHSIPIWNTITYELTTLGYEVGLNLRCAPVTSP